MQTDDAGVKKAIVEYSHPAPAGIFWQQFVPIPLTTKLNPKHHRT